MFAVWHRHTHRIAGWLAAEKKKKKKKKKRRKKKKGPSISAATAAAAESLRRRRAAASWATGATTVEASRKCILISHFHRRRRRQRLKKNRDSVHWIHCFYPHTHTKLLWGLTGTLKSCALSAREREKERKKVGVCILLGAIARTLRPILCLCEREKERKRESMAVW